MMKNKNILLGLVGVVIVGAAVMFGSGGNLTGDLGSITDPCLSVKLGTPNVNSFTEFQKALGFIPFTASTTNCLQDISFIVTSNNTTAKFKYDSVAKNYVYDSTNLTYYQPILPYSQFLNFNARVGVNGMNIAMFKPVSLSSGSNSYMKNGTGKENIPIADTPLKVAMLYKGVKQDEKTFNFKSVLKSFTVMVNGVAATPTTVMHPGDKVSVVLASNSADCGECANYRVVVYGPNGQSGNVIVGEIADAYHTDIVTRKPKEIVLPNYDSTSTTYKVNVIVFLDQDGTNGVRDWSGQKYSILK